MSDQPDPSIEWPYDHYVVEIRHGPLFEESPLRTHRALTVEDAVNLIEGLRTTYGSRAEITWQAEEVNDEGKLYGLASDQTVYMISVIPPLTTQL